MKEEIEKIFRGDLEDNEITLEKYSHSASLFDVRPKLIAFPRDSEDVKKIVAWVNENKDKYKNKYTNLCIVTYQDILSVPIDKSADTIFLDIARYMGESVSLDEKNIKNISEMEVIFSDGTEGRIRPFTPAQLQKKIKEKTIEGKIYGRIYELIKENIAEHLGRHYRKDFIFDLRRLFLSSQGTFGIITKTIAIPGLQSKVKEDDLHSADIHTSFGVFLDKMRGEKDVSIFDEIKKVSDPKDILNPGRKIELTKKRLTKLIVS